MHHVQWDLNMSSMRQNYNERKKKKLTSVCIQLQAVCSHLDLRQ